MDQEQRAKYLNEAYGLNTEQGIEADRLMTNTPMRDWPQPLKDIVGEAGRRFGHSGDVIWECIVAYIKGQTLDEALNSGKEGSE